MEAQVPDPSPVVELEELAAALEELEVVVPVDPKEEV